MEGAFPWNIPLSTSQARWYNRWVQRDGLKLRFRGRTAVTWGNCWLFLKRPLPKKETMVSQASIFKGRTGSFLGGYIFFEMFFYSQHFFFGLLYGTRINILMQRKICGHFNFQVTPIQNHLTYMGCESTLYIYIYMYT